MSIEIKVPALGESISEAVIAKWLKQPGDFVNTDETILELETDKVTVGLPSPQSGTIDKLTKEGVTVKIGETIGMLTPLDKAPTDHPSQSSEKMTPAKEAEKKALNVQNQPSGESLTQQKKLPQIQNSTPPQAVAPAHFSPAQRKSFYIGEDSVSHASPVINQQPATLAEKTVHSEEIVPMTPLRKKIAERLIEAQNTAAILTTFNEVDMSAVMDLRQKHQDSFVKKHGVKLGFMSFFSRATVLALQTYKGLNAEIRGDKIIYKKNYDLGIAVGSGKGLVVPVVRGVDKLSLADIEKEIARLAQKVKENTLSIEDLSHGTFTITNGGIYGSMMSTPILNMPQTGILGMHNITKRPVCINDKVEIRPMMYLALSYDHRVVDGREAVQFLVHIKELIESPERLLLQI